MIFKGNGVVWDGEKNKPLCKFVKGSLSTLDQRTISILERNNYQGELTDEDFEEPKTDPVEAEKDSLNVKPKVKGKGAKR